MVGEMFMRTLKYMTRALPSEVVARVPGRRFRAGRGRHGSLLLRIPALQWRDRVLSQGLW